MQSKPPCPAAFGSYNLKKQKMQNTSDNQLLQRLEQLEERMAHQDKQLDELSEQLAEQWKVNDKLQARLGTLVERFQAVEESTTPTHETARPPHW